MTTCYLCGKEGADTTEHVVPRCLFPGKLPQDVPTLPAHLACNKFTELHEEAFRNHIATAIPEGNPGLPLWNATRRAIQRPEAAGMRRDFYNKIVSRMLVDPDGVQRPSPVHLMDDERCDWVIAKIVKGLFTLQTGELLLPKNVRWRFGQADKGRDDVVLPDAFDVHPVLHVRWGRAIDEPFGTFWILGFYKTGWFWAFTAPTSRWLANRLEKRRPLIWPGPGRR
jgi:hypothetical protein